MKVGVCFYGITRSLRYTNPSIKKNIFDHLTNNNIKYDIYASFFLLKEETDRDNNTTVLSQDEYKLLDTKKLHLEVQDDFDKITDFTSVNNFYYISNTCKNIARSQYLLKKLTDLWIEESYDVIIYMRPDTKVLEKINVNDLYTVYKNKNCKLCYIADHSHCNGINDRFAFGTPSAMKIYGNRQSSLESFFKFKHLRKKLESEAFLEYHLQNNAVQIRKTNMKVIRIRSNGKIAKYDIKMIKR